MFSKPHDLPLADGEVEIPHVAKVGVRDAGHNVTSAADEPINGVIADIADGDD
jgi:hypothetical protein